MTKPLAFLAAAALAAAISAQSLTLPPAVANGFEGSSSTGTLWSSGASATGTGTAMRQQMFYARDTIPSGTITINRLRWRANGSTATTVGGIWSNVTIQMCSSALPYSAPSTTFASNYGPDLATVFTGNVTVAPTAPAYPGVFYVDVPLTTPFVYSGAGDLLIEVSWAAGSYLGGATTTVDYHIPTGTPAARLYSTTAAATTGSLNTSAGIVVNFDYIADPTPATKLAYGYDCYDSAYYEFFSPGSTFDLNGSAIRMQPNTLGGYTVSAVPLNLVPPIAAPFPAADDAVSVATLPFTFSFPGGTTTQIGICTNGFIWLDGTTTSTDLSPTATELLTLAPRLAVAWTDWNVNPASTSGGNGTYHYDIDPSNTVVYATWNGIGAYGWSATFGGPVARTFQCKLFADGSIEYHYVTADNPYNIKEQMVGLKPGLGTFADPGNRNLSFLPTSAFNLAGGVDAGLTLDLVGLPRSGSTVNFVTGNLPATTALSVTVLAFGSVIPGIDLAPLGMPGCHQNVGLLGVMTLGIGIGTPTASVPLTIPNDPVFRGWTLFTQSLAWVPAVNPAGALTSNGLLFTLGN